VKPQTIRYASRKKTFPQKFVPFISQYFQVQYYQNCEAIQVCRNCWDYIILYYIICVGRFTTFEGIENVL